MLQSLVHCGIQTILSPLGRAGGGEERVDVVSSMKGAIILVIRWTAGW